MTKGHTVMKRFSLAAKARALFGICGFVAVCLFATLAFAHGGEDHGNDEAAKGESSVAARLAASSAQYEIVGVPTGQSGGKLTLYVTDFLSNKPVANAAIDVAVNDTTERAKVSGNHYELAAPWVKTPGNYALTFSVTAGESSDLLIATLEIPAAAVQEVHETVWDHIIPHDGKAPSGLLITISAFNVGQPISHRLDHLLSGVRAEIALKIFGDDTETLRTLAETLRSKLAGIRGIVDLQVEKQVLIPQLEVKVDPDRARLYGISPSAVTEALSSLSNGRTVSTVVDEAKRFDVVLRLSEQDRTTSGLADLLIETPKGRVPLRFIAEVSETQGPNQILRENGRRRIVVLANTDGSDMSAVVQQIRQTLAGTPLPAGYSTSLEGTFQAQEEASRLILSLAVISLASIFVVLFSRYRSAVLALIIMGNVPLAFIGSVAALYLAGQPLSVASMIGFITLTGISARNGILKISHYINLALHEGEIFGERLVMRGSLERLTPVLMTALSAGLALTPLLLDADAPGKEILHPVAVTIFGGLVSATLLDLIVTPLLFLRFGKPALERLAAPPLAQGNTILAETF